MLTLALGLGASSVIFCLIDGLWLHPMHISQPGRMVRIFGTTSQEQEGMLSYTEYQTITARASAFQGAYAGVIAMGGRGSLMPNPDGTSTCFLITWSLTISLAFSACIRFWGGSSSVAKHKSGMRPQLRRVTRIVQETLSVRYVNHANRRLRMRIARSVALASTVLFGLTNMPTEGPGHYRQDFISKFAYNARMATRRRRSHVL